MNFNYPSFLWALVALVIPIIIHLFNFRKTTRIYFSNTKLLRQVKQETTQKRKLKQYLVLASRLLFLLFLVLAFAQPFLPSRESISTQQNVIIYLDNSHSMTVPTADNSRGLDAAIAFAQEVTELFPAETRYRFITNDFAPFSNSYKNKAEVSDLLTQIRLSPISRSWQEVMNQLSEKDVTVFWISDFQKSTLKNITPPDSSWALRLVPVAVQHVSNIFVDSVYLENPWMTGEKNSLKAIVRNNGPKKTEGVVAKLIINNVQAGTSTLSVEPNSAAKLTFDLSSGRTGLNEAKLSFTDFPVSYDNDFYFTLNAAPKLKIAEIKTEAKSTFIEKVYGNRDLFSFSSFTKSNVDYSVVADADLVIVNGLDRFDEPMMAALAQIGSKGNNILLIPSSKPDLPSYQRIVSVPLHFVAKEMIELDVPDFQNPFFENVFEEKTATMALPHAKQIIDWGSDASAILKFKDGASFLSRYGNTYLLSAPMEKGYSDFFTNALFVPVMYRIASYERKIDQRHYYSLSANLIPVKTDSLFGEEPLKLLGSKEIIPSQSKRNGEVLLELPRFEMTQGFYRVIQKRDTIDLLAFNLNHDESILDRHKADDVKTMAGGSNRISVFESSDTEAFARAIKEKYLGTPLWKYALILALTFLLAEVLLIRFMK